MPPPPIPPPIPPLFIPAPPIPPPILWNTRVTQRYIDASNSGKSDVSNERKRVALIKPSWQIGMYEIKMQAIFISNKHLTYPPPPIELIPPPFMPMPAPPFMPAPFDIPPPILLNTRVTQRYIDASNSGKSEQWEKESCTDQAFLTNWYVRDQNASNLHQQQAFHPTKVLLTLLHLSYPCQLHPSHCFSFQLHPYLRPFYTTLYWCKQQW